MKNSVLQKLIGIMEKALTELGAVMAPDTLEALAVTIHKSMTYHSRRFHNLDHVLAFYDPTNPIQSLAALYHDIVYYQVDRGIHPDIHRVLAPYIQEQDGEIHLTSHAPLSDRLFYLVLEIFDCQPGQRCTQAEGLNELLSALFMVKTLQGIVPETPLLKMVVCIEATIPFRSANAEGKSHFEQMEERLGDINRRYRLGWQSAEIINTIHLAVAFANQDVANFAARDVEEFLQNTWKLLPETNFPLRSREIYTIREYRQALQKMEAFMGALKPENVFHQYRGVPSRQKFARLVQRTGNNLATARAYLQIKLLTIGILEALAEVTGGDAPLSLFMGDVTLGESRRLEDYLPGEVLPDYADHSSALYRLLDSRGDEAFDFDTARSPLALYLYRSVPTERFDQYWNAAQAMFCGKLPAEAFLQQLDPHILSVIACAAAEMVSTRRKQLLRYTAGGCNPSVEV